ncbi:cytochrome P450 3A8-like [Dermacentor andersoni]|uniref:cytochrome P450 3A8-like n=1 Tax=Dermacentor andersoni TaxID=34620 RepID=UPI003B3AA46C
MNIQPSWRPKLWPLFSLYRWRKRKFSVFKELGIPGPEPSLIFGNLLELRRKGFGTVSREWTKKYGKVVGYYNGDTPGIILRDIEFIKRIYIQDFQNFTGRRPLACISQSVAINEVRISRVSGDDWRNLKKIVLPAFKTGNVKRAVPLLQECVEECFRAMDRKLAGSDGCIEVFEPFCIMAADFGLQFFAGARTDIQRGDASAMALCKAARESVGQFGGSKLFFLKFAREELQQDFSPAPCPATRPPTYADVVRRPPPSPPSNMVPSKSMTLLDGRQ